MTNCSNFTFRKFFGKKYRKQQAVFLGFDTRFIKLEFHSEPICRLGFLIASRNKVLRAISWFRAPPRKCWKCENHRIFAISFERDRAFKFCFEGLEANVPETQKQKENSDQLCLQACGRARRSDFRSERQNLTRDIFRTRAIQTFPFAVSLLNLALVRRFH